MKSKISLFSLVILIVSAIDSIRTLPTTAFFGFSLIFFYLLAAVIFLFPVGFISAEFSSRYPEDGGIFHWVRHAFGNKVGVLAVWLQWINTMVWYPTMLLFIGGTAAYLINPTLSENRAFLLLASLSAFWLLTCLNLKGIKASVKINSFCGIVGTLVPMTALIFLGIWWISTDNTIAMPFSLKDAIPSLDLFENSNALITVMASLLGMELAGVHVSDIKNPQKNFPKAIIYSVLILLGTLILASLSIAFVVPNQDIHFVDGIMQTFTKFLIAFNAPYLSPLFALLIILGAVGGSVNWILSPAKGLVQATEKGFLPMFFLAKNKNGASHRILIAQALVVTFFCCLMHLISSINTYYWFLMALSTALYMLMYAILFLAALKLKRPNEEKTYRIPKGMRTILCLLGIFACLITIVIGFQPAPDVAIENKILYIFIIVTGFSLMLLPVMVLWKYQEKQKIEINPSIPK